MKTLFTEKHTLKQNVYTLFLCLIISIKSFSQPETDYSDLNNWYFHPEQSFNYLNTFGLDIAVIDKNLGIDSVITIDNNASTNTGVDVFFVHPTIMDEYPIVPDTVSIADQPLFQIAGTVIAQGGLLAKYGRFYAPKYRQASPSCFRDFYPEDERAEYLSIAYSDIKNAFLDYLENHNNGNKFIIAGHSQGSFLLGLLLRDVIDSNPELREKMVTTALGGMGYIYAAPNEFQGGWWENIPLCTTTNECGCIHNWKTFKEGQVQPAPNTGFPEFNQVLIDNDWVFRSPDLDSDWFVQDSLFYGSEPEPLRYYIAPDAGYSIAEGYNFIAFDSLYTTRYKRTSALDVLLAVDYINDPTDLRPNDLLPEEDHPNYDVWGFHTKDYHVYLWALMSQIDEKLVACSNATGVNEYETDDFTLFPNPSTGIFTVQLNSIPEANESMEVFDLQGKQVVNMSLKQQMTFVLKTPGMYVIQIKHISKKIMVVE